MMHVTTGVDQGPAPQEAKAPVHQAFAVHKLNPLGIHKAELIAEAFNDILTALMTVCPPGREFSIVTTKLEEACFFAKKSMAQDQINHQA